MPIEPPPPSDPPPGGPAGGGGGGGAANDLNAAARALKDAADLLVQGVRYKNAANAIAAEWLSFIVKEAIRGAANPAPRRGGKRPFGRPRRKAVPPARQGRRRRKASARRSLTAKVVNRAVTGFLRGGIRGAATGAMRALGPVGIGLTAFGAAAARAVVTLNALSREQQNYTRQLANVSASMAMIDAERQMRETFRDMEKGERLSGAARQFNRARQTGEDDRTELTVLWERVKYNVATGWENLKSAFTRPMNDFARAFNKLIENTDSSRRERWLSMSDFLKEIAAEDQRARARDDPNWRQPKFRDPWGGPPGGRGPQPG